MKKIIARILAIVSVFTPSFVFAQELRNIDEVVSKATRIGDTFVVILISFAVIYIIFNIVRYLVMGGDDETARTKAKDSILWGVIGLVVIFSIWGLVNIIRNSFSTNNNQPNMPRVIVPPAIGGAVQQP